ncbi:MAG: biotin--[Eubacterium sp.]|nr:biotin--[acetyl-CoA-carboxylase] ligase [Eubacterium sp.]
MTNKESSKEKVLSLLEWNRGTFISGEQLAGQLQISRNSVWKAVRALRKEGYVITAVTNRGYCLTEENDRLSAQGIRSYLQHDASHHALREQSEISPADGSFPKVELCVYEELPSTNMTAKELAIQGAPHGTVVIAERQTAGAGRASGSFFSPEGGLYMSIILRPEQLPARRNAGPEEISAGAEKAAVETARAIEAVCGVNPEIRGKGDLFLQNRKICGILTESGGELETGITHYLVLGIGIHFSTPADAFPEELRSTCGSIFPDASVAKNRPVHANRNHLAAEIIRRILLQTKKKES